MLVHAVPRRLRRTGLVTLVVAPLVAAAACAPPLPPQAEPEEPTVTRTVLLTPEGRPSVPVLVREGTETWYYPPSLRAINDRGQVVGETRTGTPEWWQPAEPMLWQDGDDRATRLAANDATAVLVNDRGQVVIEPARVPEGQPLPGPTVWEDGEAVELSRDYQHVRDINERGELLIASAATGDHWTVAVWADGRTTLTVGPPRRAEYIFPDDISDTGTIVGTVGYLINPIFRYYEHRPFVWRDGRLTVIDMEGSATAVNNSGQVLLELDPQADGSTRKVLWEDGVTTELGLDDDYIGGIPSRHLNDQGQVAGVKDGRAHLWDDGRLIDLGTPEGTTSQALAVNERAQVVGKMDMADGTTHGFVWTSGHLLDLGPICYNLATCDDMDINDRGQVIGQVGEPGPDDDARAVLWEIHDRAFPDAR